MTFRGSLLLATALVAASGASAADSSARFLPPAIPPALKASLPPLAPAIPEPVVPAAPTPTAPRQAQPPVVKPTSPSCDLSGFPSVVVLRAGESRQTLMFKGPAGCLTGVSADALWLDVEVRQASREILISANENHTYEQRTARLYLLTGGRSIDLDLVQDAKKLELPLAALPVPTWELAVPPLADAQLSWEPPAIEVPMPNPARDWERAVPLEPPEVQWAAPASLPPAGYDEL